MPMFWLDALVFLRAKAKCCMFHFRPEEASSRNIGRVSVLVFKELSE